jgi:hypothetical protein
VIKSAKYEKQQSLPACHPGPLSLCFTSCFLKQDRTTTVYGTITDENGQPVDSILILATGLEWWYSTKLHSTYSDGNGNYEVLIEVPKKYDALDVTIPAYSEGNEKYYTQYKVKNILMDGKRVSSCCTASIGSKTRYDFELRPR